MIVYTDIAPMMRYQCRTCGVCVAPSQPIYNWLTESASKLGSGLGRARYGASDHVELLIPVLYGTSRVMARR